jgi:hypothetical protein
MQKKRDLSDELRTILWYEYLCTYLELSEGTPHQIEVEVKKRLYGRYVKPTGGWEKFKRGKRVPRRAFGQAVESIVPRSWYLVNHPLWTSLRNDFDVQTQAEKLLRALPVEIRCLVYDRQNDLRKKVTRRLLNNLEMYLRKKEELSVLACFVIFLHEAHTQKNAEMVDVIGGYILDALLLLLGAGIFQSVAPHLLEIFCTRIFSLTEGGSRICIHDSSLFFDAIKTIQEALMLNEQMHGKFASTEEKFNVAMRLIFRDMAVQGSRSVFWQLKMRARDG